MRFVKSWFLQIVVSSRRRAFSKFVFCQIAVSSRRRAFSSALGPYFEATCPCLGSRRDLLTYRMVSGPDAIRSRVVCSLWSRRDLVSGPRTCSRIAAPRVPTRPVPVSDPYPLPYPMLPRVSTRPAPYRVLPAPVSYAPSGPFRSSIGSRRDLLCSLGFRRALLLHWVPNLLPSVFFTNRRFVETPRLFFLSVTLF